MSAVVPDTSDPSHGIPVFIKSNAAQAIAVERFSDLRNSCCDVKKRSRCRILEAIHQEPCTCWMMESCSAVRSAILISIAVCASAVRLERRLDSRADLKTEKLCVHRVSASEDLHFLPGLDSFFRRSE